MSSLEERRAARRRRREQEPVAETDENEMINSALCDLEDRLARQRRERHQRLDRLAAQVNSFNEEEDLERRRRERREARKDRLRSEPAAPVEEAPKPTQQEEPEDTSFRSRRRRPKEDEEDVSAKAAAEEEHRRREEEESARAAEEEEKRRQREAEEESARAAEEEEKRRQREAEEASAQAEAAALEEQRRAEEERRRREEDEKQRKAAQEEKKRQEQQQEQRQREEEEQKQREAEERRKRIIEEQSWQNEETPTGYSSDRSSSFSNEPICDEDIYDDEAEKMTEDEVELSKQEYLLCSGDEQENQNICVHATDNQQETLQLEQERDYVTTDLHKTPTEAINKSTERHQLVPTPETDKFKLKYQNGVKRNFAECRVPFPETNTTNQFQNRLAQFESNRTETQQQAAKKSFEQEKRLIPCRGVNLKDIQKKFEGERTQPRKSLVTKNSRALRETEIRTNCNVPLTERHSKQVTNGLVKDELKVVEEKSKIEVMIQLQLPDTDKAGGITDISVLNVTGERPSETVPSGSVKTSVQDKSVSGRGRKHLESSRQFIIDQRNKDVSSSLGKQQLSDKKNVVQKWPPTQESVAKRISKPLQASSLVKMDTKHQAVLTKWPPPPPSDAIRTARESISSALAQKITNIKASHWVDVEKVSISARWPPTQQQSNVQLLPIEKSLATSQPKLRSTTDWAPEPHFARDALNHQHSQHNSSLMQEEHVNHSSSQEDIPHSHVLKNQSINERSQYISEPVTSEEDEEFHSSSEEVEERQEAERLERQKQKEEAARRRQEEEEKKKKGKRKGLGGLSPEKKKRLKQLIMQKAAEDLKNEAKRKAEEREHYINERVEPLATDGLKEAQLQDMIKKLHSRVAQLEEEVYDWEFKIRKQEFEINDLTLKVNDTKGKFVKPVLRKISKTESKLAKLERKDTKDFRGNLKSTGQSKFALEEEGGEA